MKNLFYLLLFTLIISCGKDESEKNPFVGSYIAKSLKLTYDTSPADNVDITFSEGEDCVDAPDGFFGAEEYCRKGKLIINEDNTFSSTIEYIWNLPDVGTSTTRYNLKGNGTVSISENSVILCYKDNDCYEFTLTDNLLTNDESVGSTLHTHVVLIKE